MSTSAVMHVEDDPERSTKPKQKESLETKVREEAENRGSLMFTSDSSHLKSMENNLTKERCLTGQRSKPKLVSAQAVLSSRLLPESIQEEPVVTSENATGTPGNMAPNAVMDYHESNGGKPTDEEREEKDGTTTSTEKDSLTDSSKVSRKAMWRAGQRARWKGKRRERLGGSVEDLTQESEAEAVQKDLGNHEIRWRHQQQHWGCKESKDQGSIEKEDRLCNRSRGQGTMEGDSETKGSVSHNILSRVLAHSLASSSSSSSSSFNCSSAESDEVFSEGEEIIKKKDMRRCRSWRTFLTMMQWSLRRQSSWIQLAGHQGNIQLGEGGEVLKRFNEVEDSCLQALMSDPLRRFVPRYYGQISRNGETYIRLEDLLSGLKQPVIMDCKMGIRTYLEEEIVKARTKASLRTDMYQKMVKVDPTAPTEEEHERKGVTKLRYMQWRDSTSSTTTLGFRIEGIMMETGVVLRDFNKTKAKSQIIDALLLFSNRKVLILKAYLSRLEELKETLKESAFFSSHEVIGGSLLFVHDHTGKANIWMIDFGKTTPTLEGVHLKHDVPWVEGNHEDGYVIGLNSLISLLREAISEAAGQILEKQNQQTHHQETNDKPNPPQTESTSSDLLKKTANTNELV
ncbi:inositol-trisphosphate 3-kinase A-like [Astyanax mexicanus]|uniref:Kinase n=1 Tax=Astyanax mexicanus TaxID=7994 RepID=A0A8B9KQJ8_ASTMX|nr:inositol-trisphosphate 3-kinase A-like [Astyanax mexicanus]